jgi:hypothetical protein
VFEHNSPPRRDCPGLTARRPARPARSSAPCPAARSGQYPRQICLS